MKHVKHTIILIVLAVFFGAAGFALAAGYPWRDHAPPYDFRFGNHFDMHQQSHLLDNGQLQGFQYIEFTGATAQGYPVAVHGQATVGWEMHGIPGMATLVDLSMPHPTWCVDPANLPKQPGYVHFHWVGAPLTQNDTGKKIQGFFLKHTAIETFYFQEHETLVTQGIDFNFAPNILTSCP